MSRNLVNLLPRDRIEALRREYFVRLATVALFLLSALVVAHGVFLIPSYLLAAREAASERAALAAIEAAHGGEEASGVTARLSALAADATYLAQLEKSPSAAAAVRALLSMPRAGIEVESLSFTPAAGADAAKMTLAGKADTREDLRAYDVALANAPFIANVDLPVSDYANATDINFSMTLTGNFSP